MMPRLAIVVALLVAAANLQAVEPPAPAVSFRQTEDSLSVIIGGQTVGEYVFRDDQILRPYFRHLRTLSGKQVTRNSPPIKPGDLDDHATMHPGLWVAFGDLGGADFWRNKGLVQQQQFLANPQGGAGVGSFSVRNAYVAGGQTICTEDCSITFLVKAGGYRIDWSSTFRSERSDFAFGDQEEMGFGVRVATPLAVVNGGEILVSRPRLRPLGGQPIRAQCVYQRARKAASSCQKAKLCSFVLDCWSMNSRLEKSCRSTLPTETS